MFLSYSFLGGQKFYDKKEIKDLLAYLSVVLNPGDEISLRRILNVPNRGIGNRTLEKFQNHLETFSNEDRPTLFSAMSSNPQLAEKQEKKHIKEFTSLILELRTFFEENSLKAGLLKLVDAINYLKFIDKQYDDNLKLADVKKNDVEALIASAERFQQYVSQKTALKSFVEKINASRLSRSKRRRG